jgi:hypothetical protein
MEDVGRLSYSREDIQYFRVKARDQSDFSVTSDEEYCDDEIPLGLHKILLSSTMLTINQVCVLHRQVDGRQGERILF